MGNLFSNTNTNTNTNLNKKKYSSDKNIKSNKIITEDKNFQIKQIHQKNTIQIISKEPFEFDYKKYKIGKNLEIKFKNSFNDQIDDKIINKFRLFDKIIFGFSFNQDVKYIIPSNILFIQFGHNFNNLIDNLVIKNEQDKIQEIILGEKFNQPVNNLSPNIKKILFGYEFNYPVINLPNGLEYIKFGNDFNHNVDYLPCSLTCVVFGN